jgi:tetratricopeptide (TPR) repeat protein
MYRSESAAIDYADAYTELEEHSESHGAIENQEIVDGDDALSTALTLLDRGRPIEADRLLTAALLAFPRDDRLWLAAGICRMRRGAHRAALSAFEMSVWLSGDSSAKELYRLYTAQA